MNKQAFKLRMRELKSYREQNPDKGYLDWKSYKDGGEVGDEEKQYLTNWFNKRRLYAKEKMPVMNRQLDDLQSRMTTSTYDTAKYRETGHPYYAKGLDLVPISIDSYKVKLTDPNARGYYHPNEGIVMSEDYQKWNNREPLLHEASHVLNSNADAVHKLINTIIQGAEMRDRGLKLNEYMSRPEEIHSRLMEFRKLNNLDPTKMYGIPDIKKWRREGKDANILDNFKDDNVILDLINTVANNKSKIIKAARGGEIPPANKPILPAEKIPYKGKLYKDRYGKQYTEYLVDDYYNNSSDEIDRFTGRPFVKGLKGIIDLEDVANATPLGDVVSAYDMYDAAKNNDWTGVGLASLGLMPFVPNFGKKLYKKGEKAVTETTKRYIPKVEPNYKLNSIAKHLEQLKAYEDMPLDVVDRIVDERNRTYEMMLEPYVRDRAKKIDTEFGTDYVDTYNAMLQEYLDINKYFDLPTPKYAEVTNPTNVAFVKPSESKQMNFNRDRVKKALDIPNNVILHEMGHLVDGAAGMNNSFLRKLQDRNKFVSYREAKVMYPSLSKEFYDNVLQGTEIKSYMNLFRNYLNENGKLFNGDYTGSYKNLKKDVINAPNDSFNVIKILFNLYKSPKLFNKDFKTIPIVNNNKNNTLYNERELS